MTRSILSKAGAAGLAMLAAGCGVEPPGDSHIEAKDGCHEKVVPPQAYYDALMEQKTTQLGLVDAKAPHVLFVNFDGATVKKGFKRAESFILCAAEATIPASNLSPVDRDEVIARVSEHFKAAGVALNVVASKPAGGDYTTMHVGGSYGTLGCTESRSTLGIAPFDDRNANRNDVGFVFDAFEADAGVLADTIAHEAGHSFGLDHTINIKDLMHSTARADDLAFAISQIVNSSEIQDGPALLRANIAALPGFVDPSAPGDATNGGTNPAPASPPGGGSTGGSGGLFSGITVLGNLLGQLQPSQVLDVSKLLPGFAALVPGLVPGFAPGSGTNPFNGGNFSSVLAALPGLPQINTLISMAAPGFTGTVPGAAGGLDPAKITSLIALAAFGGYGSVPAALIGGQASLAPMMNMLFQMLGMNLAGTGALPAPATVATQLPSYMSAFNLNGMTSAPALISAMTSQADFINTNYTGTTQQALISGLMVAASQAYTQLPSN